MARPLETKMLLAKRITKPLNLDYVLTLSAPYLLIHQHNYLDS